MKPAFALALWLATSWSFAAERIVLVAGGGADTNTTAPLQAASARLSAPFGVDFDAEGNLYLVEMTGNRVRQLDDTGMLKVIAGTGEKGDANGPALEAQFNGIHNLAVFVDQIFLADTWNNRVRVLFLSNGKVIRAIGTGEKGFSGDGQDQLMAKFGGIYCVSIGGDRQFYLADLDNLRIRAVDPKSGKVRTVAGNGTKGVPRDGARATEAPLLDPRAVIADAAGRVYILERSGNALRVVDTNGTIRTVAGTGAKGFSGDGGDALHATFNGPKHLCFDLDGSVLIADTENHAIRRYTPRDGKIARVAGTGAKGSRGVGGPPLECELNQPHGVTVRRDGTLYICDSSNNRVLRIESSLQSRLSNHIAAPRFAAAAWGVKIVSLDTGKTLFEHDAQKLLKPASNAKLYTSALALDRLGPDFRIKTSLLARAVPDKSGTLRGDLVVFGRGDPTFAARFHDGAHTNLLAPLVDALAAAGVKRIKGDLVGDESFFRGPPLGSQWAWDDLQYYYGAEVSALTVEDNTLDLIFSPGARLEDPCRIRALPATSGLRLDNRTRTAAAGGRRDISLYRPIGENIVYVSGQLPIGGTNLAEAVAVHQPAQWFVMLLAEALARRGISVSGKIRAQNWLDSGAQPRKATNLVEIASVNSPPLAAILPKMLKPSQNLYAQLLLLQVGAQRHQPTNEGRTTEDLGLIELRGFLAGSGIDPAGVLLEDGSGLSRGTLVTPNATVALLQLMHRHPHAQVFHDALPVAGIDGTLRNRMKGTAAAGNAHAKTGTLRYVNTLSGYVTTKAGEQVVFSLMLNNYDGTNARNELDRIVLMLAGWEGRSPQDPHGL